MGDKRIDVNFFLTNSIDEENEIKWQQIEYGQENLLIQGGNIPFIVRINGVDEFWDKIELLKPIW